MSKNTPLRRARIQRINETRFKRDVERKTKAIRTKPYTIKGSRSGALTDLHTKTLDRMTGKQAQANANAYNSALGSYTVKTTRNYNGLFFYILIFTVMFGSMLDIMLKHSDAFDYQINDIESIMNAFKNYAIMSDISSVFTIGIRNLLYFIKELGAFARNILNALNYVIDFTKDSSFWTFNFERYFIDFGKYLDFWKGWF